jgi:hypothetical protein
MESTEIKHERLSLTLPEIPEKIQHIFATFMGVGDLRHFNGR